MSESNIPQETTVGWVYILSNEAMKGFVKIGITLQNDVQSRIAQLYTTGVPAPFQVEYAAKVNQPRKVENALHNAFRTQRPNASREFFTIDADQAIPIIKLLEINDLTDEVTKEANDNLNAIDREAINIIRKRNPPLDFFELGIPYGSELHFINGQEVAKIVSNRKIEHNGEISSLTKLTVALLGKDYNVQPTGYWMYNGRNLRDIYREYYTN